MSTAPSVTVVIPHRDTPDWLVVSVGLWRCQRPKPFVHVVDTGSQSLDSQATLERLDRLDGVEVARLNIGSTAHPSDNIAMAMDFAFSRCETPFLLATHVDVFPKRRDLTLYMLSQCSMASPVVGWEMSPRGEGARGDDFGIVSNGFPGHCCTIFCMETMDRIGAGWSLRRSATCFGTPRGRHPLIKGWPDTETCLGFVLKENGIASKFLGRETNNANQETAYWTHARSRTNEGETTRHHAALLRAKRRLRAWSLQESRELPPTRRSHQTLEERVASCPFRYPMGEKSGCGLLRSHFRSHRHHLFTVPETTCRACCSFPEPPTTARWNAAIWQALYRVSAKLLADHSTAADLKSVAARSRRSAVLRLCEQTLTPSIDGLSPDR